MTIMLLLLFAVFASAQTTRGPPLNGVKGIDISFYQHAHGQPDFSAIAAAGYSFVFLKATEGNTIVDRSFTTDWPKVKDAGLLVGAYHFLRPQLPVSSAAAQAKHFANTLQLVGGVASDSLPPVIDLEQSGGLSPSNLAAYTLLFAQTLEQLTGRTPIVYSGYFFFRDTVGNPASLAKYPFWLSWYTTASQPPHFPSVYPGWTFWQNSEKGRVPGILGATDVDLDFYCCDLDSLKAMALIGGGANPPATVPPVVNPQPPQTEPPVTEPQQPVGPTPCTDAQGRSGTCIDQAQCTGTTVHNLCPGAANILCCIPPAPCQTTDGRSGICKDVSQCGGSTVSGLCPGPANIKCCIVDAPAVRAATVAAGGDASSVPPWAIGLMVGIGVALVALAVVFVIVLRQRKTANVAEGERPLLSESQKKLGGSSGEIVSPGLSLRRRSSAQ